MALIAGVAALPATAAPLFFQGVSDAPFMVAGRDNGELKVEANQDERQMRKTDKRSLKKEVRKNERGHESGQEHESDQPGYGYGYERRYPASPTPANPRFDDRGRR